MTKNDLVVGFKKLGLEQGDNLFVTSSLSRFGHVEGGSQSVIDALRECVGSGTIVMPAFNFSIFKEKPILLTEFTPSEMGAITETFRQQANRTNNLFHPLCYQGSVDFSKCDTYDTWGDRSPYGLMHHKNFKMVLLGTEFYSCPIFHYCEQRHNVPYREPVEYEGFICDIQGEHNVRCRRLRRKYSDSDHNKVYGEFPVVEVKIGKSICRSFYVGDLVNFLDEKLNENPNYLKLETELLTPMPTMGEFNMMELIKDLYKEPRYLVSDGFKNSLDYISQIIPLRYHSWKSGEKVWTWTIPLKEPDKTEGELWVGEYTVKGYTDECIILPIHLDHAGMANDNLSGVAVAIQLILTLLRTPDLKYSYKFLFVPETIGTIAYLSRFTETYKYGIVFD